MISSLQTPKCDLNDNFSNWKFLEAGVPQRPLFFLIHINDLPQGLICDVKILLDDTSLFPKDNYTRSSASALNKDLLKIKDCEN